MKNLKGHIKWNKISVTPDLSKMQEKELFNHLSKQSQERNEASDVGDESWKVIGRREKNAFLG